MIFIFKYLLRSWKRNTHLLILLKLLMFCLHGHDYQETVYYYLKKGLIFANCKKKLYCKTRNIFGIIIFWIEFKNHKIMPRKKVFELNCKGTVTVLQRCLLTPGVCLNPDVFLIYTLIREENFVD